MENMSDAEFNRKEKNKIAARKCRVKKDMLTKELKQKNDELELENRTLTEEIELLQQEELEYLNTIKSHRAKGCVIPAQYTEIWNKELTAVSVNNNALDAGTSQEMMSPESSHAPPTSPEHTYPEKTSPSTQNVVHKPSEVLTLFSGKPLVDLDVTRRRSNSSSSSRSSLSPPATQASSKFFDIQKDLRHFLASDKLPRVLAPISTTSVRHRELTGGMTPILANHVMPTTVSEPMRVSQNVTTDISEPSDVPFGGAVFSQTQEVPKEVSTTNSEMYISQSEQDSSQYGMPLVFPYVDGGILQNVQDSSQNKLSLGLSTVDGFSFLEDLQQLQPANDSIPYKNNFSQHRNYVLGNQKTIADSQTPSTSSSEFRVPVNAIASALLDICPEMSLSLQEQIKTSYSFPSSSVAEGISMSCLTQDSQNVNKENEVMHQRLQQQVTLATQKEASAKGQQTMTNRSPGMMQRQSFNMPMKAVVLSPAQIIQNSQQLQNNKPHCFQRQMSVEIMQNAPFSERVNQGQKIRPATFTRQANQMMSLQQGPQYNKLHPQTVPAINTLISDAVFPPKDTSTTIQTLVSLSPQPVLDHNTNFVVQICSNSDGSFVSNRNNMSMQLAPQHVNASGQYSNNETLPADPQFITLPTPYASPSASTVQSLAPGGLDAYTHTSENLDYSHSIQDLPSLNLADLNSDSNLFEKKPSKANS